MRKILRLRANHADQLPRIQTLLRKYSYISHQDFNDCILAASVLERKLRRVHALLVSAKPEVKEEKTTKDIDFSNFRSRPDPCMQDLVLGAKLNDTETQKKNARILESRFGRLKVIRKELEKIVDKDEKHVCSLMRDLGEALRSINQEPFVFRSFVKRAIAFLTIGIGCTVGAFFVNTSALLASVSATILAAALATRSYLKKKANHDSKMVKLLFKDYEKEVEELSKGFAGRYEVVSRIVDETLEKCKENLDGLMNELLSQAPENKKEELETGH